MWPTYEASGSSFTTEKVEQNGYKMENTFSGWKISDFGQEDSFENIGFLNYKD